MKKPTLAAAFLIVVSAVVASAVTADAQIIKRRAVVQPTATQSTVVEVQAPVAESGKPGKVFCIVVRMELAKAYRKKGHGPLEARLLANKATDAVIASLIADAETLSGVKVVGTAIGDGKIIDAIIDFFKSPQGQALIDALIKLLLGLL